MNGLGDLRDPSIFISPLRIAGEDIRGLYDSLSLMLEIRKTEETIGKLIKNNLVKTPCHLCIGQEAVSVGIAKMLNKKDKVFGNHRSHAQFLATNRNITALIYEVLGKAKGASNGMGGSMHLVDINNGFYGSVPIVGGTIPIAVGAALAEKITKQNNIAVAYFGDGACEEGVLHESLNLAAIYKLPILFVCENNLFSSHLDIHLRQPADKMARFADAHCILNQTVDGNDLLAVSSAARLLVDNIRQGCGPGFLEAVTYRWRGHVGYKEDIDVGVNRKVEDIEAWKKRDPIRRLYEAMHNACLITEKEFLDMQQGIKTRIDSIVKEALLADYPAKDMLLGAVYANGEEYE